MRTKLNLLAAGVGTIDALGPLTDGQLDVLDVSAPHVRVYYEGLLAEGLPEPHASAVRRLLEATASADP